MATHSNNLLAAGLKGALGKQIVFRQRNGKTFISAYPDMSRRKLSPKQLKVAETMSMAAKHALDTMNNPGKLKEAQFRLDLPKNRVYNALVKEYFKENYNSQA